MSLSHHAEKGPTDVDVHSYTHVIYDMVFRILGMEQTERKFTEVFSIHNFRIQVGRDNKQTNTNIH